MIKNLTSKTKKKQQKELPLSIFLLLNNFKNTLINAL